MSSFIKFFYYAKVLNIRHILFLLQSKVKSVPENFRQAYHWGTGDYGTISTAAMERFYQLTESD